MDTVSTRDFKQINWSTIVLFTLGFWLSASLVIDTVIIPGLSAAGMMSQEGFASAGFIIFGIFNRVELLCAALVLTSFLIFSRNHNLNIQQERLSIVLSIVLVAIATTYTYFLTPQMSGLGLNLNLFDTNNGMSSKMISLHEVYWGLEVIKLLAGSILLRWSYRNSCNLA